MNTTKKTRNYRRRNIGYTFQIASKLLDDLYLIASDYSKAVLEGRTQDRIVLKDLFLGIHDTYMDVICNMAPDECDKWTKKEDRVFQYFKHVRDFSYEDTK